MPNRIIKETICTSEEIDGLSDSEECFFYRLMVNCDDFGRMDARPAIIKSKCYPLKSIDIKRLLEMVANLQASGLIGLYEVEGRHYLHLISWEKHQQIRAKRSKYPSPEEGPEIIGNQLISSEIKCPRNPIQSNPIENPIQSTQTVAIAPVVVNMPVKRNGSDILNTVPNLPEQVALDFLKVRKAKRSPLTATALALIEKEAERAGLTTAQAIAIAAGRGWQSFKAEWIGREKTYAEKTQDYKDEQAAKFYKPLLEADQETLKKWGLA